MGWYPCCCDDDDPPPFGDCTHCATGQTPAQYQLVLTNLKNNSIFCAVCPTLDGTYILSQLSSGCCWEVTFSAICGYNKFTFCVDAAADFLSLVGTSGTLQWMRGGLSAGRDCRYAGVSMTAFGFIGSCTHLNPSMTAIITAL